MLSQFANEEVPLYTGYLTGIRAMELYPDGILHSPQRHFLWRKGENLARCPMKAYHLGEDTEKVASKGCVCGFYAYFSDTYAESYMPFSDGVYAVVKAYGRITHGSHGFKAEKMVILGLAPRFSVNKDLEEPVAPEADYSAGSGYFITSVLVMMGAMVTAIITRNPWWFILMALGIGGIAWAAWYNRREMERHRARYASYVKRRTEWHRASLNARYANPTLSPDWIAEAKRNYPNVRWFDSKEEMLAAFPLTGSEDLVEAT